MERSVQIHRLLFRAHPAKDHPRYFEWQLANVCIFIRENDQQRAIQKAVEKLRSERWKMIEFQGGSTLIEERVRSEGGEVWDAYQEAAAHGSFLRAFIEGLGGDRQNPMVPSVPRITEKFIDKVIERAGGRRLTAEECNHDMSRNADYLLDDRVFELKILEEEGLEVETRQAKLAELFKRPLGPLGTVELDPSTLSRDGQRRYADIVGGTIQNAVKSASKQIRSTKEHLKGEHLRGGVIVVNTGYGTLHPSMLYSLVQRYAAKDTTQVEDVIAISSWMVPGNLFDGTLYFQLEPRTPADPVLAKIAQAFWNCINEFMTEFMRSGMQLSGPSINPLQPVTFEKDGITFTSLPPDADEEKRPD
jgi:hypothetical protein